MPASAIGGPFDPCREARYTAQLAKEDAAAGHKDGEQYWKGQSEAYGFMCSLENNRGKEAPMAEGKCDPDDILCRADYLSKMKNLRKAFDDPKFRESHPSLVELAPQLDQAIKEEKESLVENLGFCDLPGAPPEAPPGEGGEGEP